MIINGKELDEWQEKAVRNAVSMPFSIINGGAGRGKTTIIKGIEQELGGNVSLCAFSGKAAARIKEATGINACTIHRLLGYDGGTFRIESLKGQHIVIDEASMLSSALLYAIISRQPESITLIGDEAQLPPVGEGQPFHDIVSRRPELVTTLEKCYRNSGAVFDSAELIRQGMTPPAVAENGGETWRIRQTGGAENTQRFILDMVCATRLDFSKDNDVILAPRNEGEHSSVDSLNAAIVQIVNPHDEGQRFRENDRILNTKNDSDMNIWNGTTGTILEVIDGGKVRFLPDDGEEVTVPADFARDNFRFAYALTVHKAQGSQYRRVVFVCLNRDMFSLLDRPMVYTAVTRARQGCLIVGEQGALASALKKRNTKKTIIQRIADMEAAKDALFV